MSETTTQGSRLKTPRLLKAMTFLALASWISLGAVFWWQEGVPKYLEWLYDLCTPFFFLANITVALSYIVFRCVDSIRRKSWPEYSAWTWLPTISVFVMLALVGLKGAVLFKDDFDDSKDLQALKAGQCAATAQRRYFAEKKIYSKDLGELLEINPEIAVAPDITFKFYKGDESEFRFSTHAKGSMVVYPFTNKGLHPFGETKVRYVGDPQKGGLPRREVTENDAESSPKPQF